MDRRSILRQCVHRHSQSSEGWICILTRSDWHQVEGNSKFRYRTVGMLRSSQWILNAIHCRPCGGKRQTAIMRPHYSIRCLTMAYDGNPLCYKTILQRLTAYETIWQTTAYFAIPRRSNAADWAGRAAEIRAQKATSSAAVRPAQSIKRQQIEN